MRYAALIALAATLWPGQLWAQDQSVCGTRTQVLTNLAWHYGERVVAQGPSMDGAFLFEFVVSPNGLTWTMLQTSPGGTRTCIVANGKDWVPAQATFRSDQTEVRVR
jgi:hypothetical protein